MTRNISKGKRHRILLQRQAAKVANSEADEFGDCNTDPDGTGSDWDTITTLHGSLEDLSGRELFEAQQVRAEVNVRAIVRYHPEIHPDRRLNFVNLGIVVNITGVRDRDHTKRELIVEGVRQG